MALPAETQDGGKLTYSLLVSKMTSELLLYTVAKFSPIVFISKCFTQHDVHSTASTLRRGLGPQYVEEQTL